MELKRIKPVIPVLLMLSASLLLLAGTSQPARALDINGNYTISSDSTFNEDLVVKPSGHLTIQSGVTVRFGDGYGIKVEGGILTIAGNRSHPVWIQGTPGSLWAGIKADSDSTIFVDNASFFSIREHGIRCMGTGHSGGGSVTITNTSFQMGGAGSTGIHLDADGQPEPFRCRIANNNLRTFQYGINITNGYHNITLQGNTMYNMFANGITVSGCEGVRVTGNSVVKAEYGIATFGSVKYPISLENNSISDCSVGVMLALVDGLWIVNNSITAHSKGIFGGLYGHLLIENNTIATIDGDIMNAVELAPTLPFTIIRNNIIMSRGRLLVLNGSGTNFAVHDNLLTNLTGTEYIDSDGDGYCDSTTVAPGTANVRIKRLRTCIFPVSGSGPTYVNPKQFVDHGPINTPYRLVSDTRSYGPRNVDYKTIYFTEMPTITRPMHLEGDNADHIVLYDPGSTVSISSVNGVTLANMSILNPDIGVHIYGSSGNITLKGIKISSKGLITDTKGVKISESSDIHLENISSWGICPGLNISKSSRVSIRDSSFVHMSGENVMITDSTDIEAVNTSLLTLYGLGLHAERSSFTWLDSMVRSSDENFILEDCFDSTISGIDSFTENTADCVIGITDSTGTRIANTEFGIGFHFDVQAIGLYGSSQNTTIDHCRFNGGGGGTYSSKAFWSFGNASGLNFADNYLSDLSSGLSILDMFSNYHMENIVLANNTFSSVNTGLTLIFKGDVNVENCNFFSTDVAILSLGHTTTITGGRMESFETGVSSAGILTISDLTMRDGINGIVQMKTAERKQVNLDNIFIYNVTEEGINITGSSLTTSGSRILSCGMDLVLTDTDGTLIRNSFLEGIPVEASVEDDSENHIELRNCSGNPASTIVSSGGTFVNWTYPVDLEVVDEIMEPLTSSLIVTSPTLGEVYNGTIGGTWQSEGLIAWAVDYSGVHDHREYTFCADDGEGSDENNTLVDAHTSILLLINHPPSVTAHGEITFPEDGNWSADINDWFRDRDELSFSLVSVNPAGKIAADLDGSVLNVSSSDDWNGNGTISIRVEDTFGAYLDETLDVNVLPVNDPPYLISVLPVLSTAEDKETWINLSGYDADIENDTLSWTNGTFDNGTVSWNGSNLTVIPDPDWYGILEIPLFLSDGNASFFTTLLVNVTPVNDPPVWSGDPVMDILMDAGTQKTIDISGMITDVDSPELSFTFDSPNATYSDGSIILAYPSMIDDMREVITMSVSDGEYLIEVLLNVTVNGTGAAGEELNIDKAGVKVDPNTGDWTVEVTGEPDQDIYVVIDGVGSFKLEETSEGNYTVTIPGELFKEGEEYGYHFSDREGGPDMTGGEFSDTVMQPDIPGEGEEGGGIPPWLYFLIGFITLIVIGVIIYAVTRSGSDLDVEE